MNIIPTISIIVPVYNSERWLRLCIDSILAQTFSDFELLLVNDGSTDNSGVICDEYADQDFRVRVFHKSNGGVSSARNLGLNNVSGKWITFIDSDDWVDNDYLESFLKVTHNADFCMSPFWIEHSDGMSSTGIGKMFFDKPVGLQQIIDHSNRLLWNICCKLYRSEIINNVHLRFEQGFDMGEDTFFNYNYLAKVKTVAVIRRAAYHYRQENQNSLSKKHPSQATVEKFIELSESILAQMPVDIDVNAARYALTSFYVARIIDVCSTRSELRQGLERPEVRAFLAAPHQKRIRKIVAPLLRLRFYGLAMMMVRRLGNPFYM